MSEPSCDLAALFQIIAVCEGFSIWKAVGWVSVSPLEVHPESEECSLDEENEAAVVDEAKNGNKVFLSKLVLRFFCILFHRLSRPFVRFGRWVKARWRIRSVLFHNLLCAIYVAGKWCLKWSTCLAIPFFAGVQVLHCIPRSLRDPELLRIILVHYLAVKLLLFVGLLLLLQYIKRRAKVCLKENTEHDLTAGIMPERDCSPKAHDKG